MFSEIESFLFFYLKKRDKILINIQVVIKTSKIDRKQQPDYTWTRERAALGVLDVTSLFSWAVAESSGLGMVWH